VVPNALDERRPEPPHDLTPAEAVYWRGFVDDMPPAWFRLVTQPLLKSYCRAAARMDDLEAAYRAAEDDESCKELEARIERQANLIARMSTKMRLTQQATYDKKKSKGPTVRKPWEAYSGGDEYPMDRGQLPDTGRGESGAARDAV
jgi:uncharacterized coiled-coil protein SlyX